MLPDMIEITVFVSCPGDVATEKEEVKRVCNTLNNSFRNSGRKIRYAVLDWKDIVGDIGLRSQEQINIHFKDYDIYLGILWMRFGSDTGKIDETTGEDFGSGTAEEFYLALDRWKANPNGVRATVFFKEPRATNPTTHSELGRVFDFQKMVEQLGWRNSFKTENDFTHRIFQLLLDHSEKVSINENISAKNEQLDNLRKSNYSQQLLSRFTKDVSTTANYIPRSITDAKSESLIVLRIEGEKEDKETILSEVVLEHKRVVLLGNAGSGKSTELQQTAAHFHSENTPLVALYKRLNTYVDEPLEEFLPEGWNQIDEDLLLILLDGLDEVQPQNFHTAIRRILSFADKHERIRIVVSARTNFFQLQSEGSSSTLPGFECYLLGDLSLYRINQFLKTNYNIDGTKFIEEVYVNGYLDLVQRPFFFEILLRTYQQQGNLELSRAEIFRAYLDTKFRADSTHYADLNLFNERKPTLMSNLERIALVMESLGRNIISDDDIRKVVGSDEKYTDLKYFPALIRKQDKEEITWSFEHNNIQEYLAAKALASRDFDSLKRFIAFKPDYNVVKPTWVNTLSFWVSIASENEVNKLIEWLIEVDKEVIVRFEADRVPIHYRTSIFYSIYNYYKDKNIWISSNKLSPKDLVRFSESPEIAEFLFREICDPNLSKRALLNAARLLEEVDFEHVAPQLSNRVTYRLIEITLEYNSRKDDDAVWQLLYVLAKIGLRDQEKVQHVFDVFRGRKNQYIRSGIYNMINRAGLVDNYLDYYLEGTTFSYWNKGDDRSDVSFGDENFLLRAGLTSVQTTISLKKIIEYFAENEGGYRFDYTREEILEKLIVQATNVYPQNPEIFDSVLKLYESLGTHHDRKSTNVVEGFFHATATELAAFNSIWRSTSFTYSHQRDELLASLIDEGILDDILRQYKRRDLNNSHITELHKTMLWNLNYKETIPALLEKLETEANKIGQLGLERPKAIDYNEIHQRRRQESFDLLFDTAKLSEAIATVFSEAATDVLTPEESRKIRHSDSVFDDDRHPMIALQIIQDFEHHSEVRKDDILRWISDSERFEPYQIDYIYRDLHNDKGLSVSAEQESFIKGWVDATLPKLDIANAVRLTEGRQGSYSTNWYTVFALFFIERFDIEIPKEKALDFTMFTDFENRHREGAVSRISKLEQLVDKSLLADRVISNLAGDIEVDWVWSDNARYAIENKLSRAYPSILSSLQDERLSVYKRNEIASLFYKTTSDYTSLLHVAGKVEGEMLWNIVALLLQNAEAHNRLIQLLHSKLLHSKTEEDKIQAAKYLMALNDIAGLEYYSDFLHRTKNSTGNAINDHYHYLNGIKDIKAIPTLLKLVLLSRYPDYVQDRFRTLESYAVDTLFKLSLDSEKKLQQVKKAIVAFIEQHSTTENNFNYLYSSIQRMETEFYSNRAQSFTLDEALADVNELFQK